MLKGAKTEEKNEVYMKRKVGVTSRGLISPIISQGDDIVAIATETLLETAKAEGFKLKEGIFWALRSLLWHVHKAIMHILRQFQKTYGKSLVMSGSVLSFHY